MCSGFGTVKDLMQPVQILSYIVYRLGRIYEYNKLKESKQKALIRL